MDDGPLDFESEDPLFPPSPPKPKRRKVIGLDDLLTDFYKEKSKLIEKESKRAKVRRSNSDDEDDEFGRKKVVLLSKFVDECQKQVEGLTAEEAIPLWGIRVFENQKTRPSLDFPELKDCSLLKSFMNNELNTLLGPNLKIGQAILEELLNDGWLPELVFTCGHVEKSVAMWTFNLMLYSSDEDLRESAYDFWCTVLPSKAEVGPCSFRIDWLPGFGELKKALEIYGYVLDSSMDISSLEMSHTGCDSEAPADNIIFWVNFVALCCQARNKRLLFSSLEAEEVLCVIISFFLDRRFQGTALRLHECLVSVTGFFTDDEWGTSCKKVAKSLAYRAPEDLNSLRLVECILGVNRRNKQLRSEVAFQILVNFIDREVSDGEEILRLIMSINVKEKDCNFFKMYIYLVLTEHWLFSNPSLKVKPLVLEMWGVFLRNCSCQITTTDMRSYASKVRNKASYLLQSTIN